MYNEPGNRVRRRGKGTTTTGGSAGRYLHVAVDDRTRLATSRCSATRRALFASSARQTGCKLQGVRSRHQFTRRSRVGRQSEPSHSRERQMMAGRRVRSINVHLPM